MNKDYLVGFLMGMGVGAGVALLFAPSSGSETRAMIADRTREGTEYLKRQAAELRDVPSKMMERGKEEVERRRESLKEAVDAGRQAYRDAVSS